MSLEMLTLLAMALQPPLTVSEALELPAAEAGDWALAGLEHGPIVEAERVKNQMAPPGEVVMIYREAASRVPLGCARRWWRVAFADRRTPSVDQAEAELGIRAISRNSGYEAALSSSEPCPIDGYALVSKGLPVSVALDALRKLRQVAAGESSLAIECKDSTRSDICKSPTNTLTELGSLPARMIEYHNGPFSIVLGVPDQPMTLVMFGAPKSNSMQVSRFLPAPF
ncbi:hypothetical protein [Blastomonas sp.]|uniref:hypothetical protein n=1 Tax=Blastomonas sp. TaxID=1909299 RepID=UPI002627A38B|nr:hypothetical protein [Blastomonas sp.]MDM7956193.1 hypothetical protein [Blastomonas sp.]